VTAAGGASNRTAEILRAPAEGSTQASLVATVLAHLTLHGNCYLAKYRDADGRVEQLLPLAPDRVQVERRHGRIVFTVTDERGRQSEHGLDDIVHIKALSTDGLVGLSPIRQMRLALELNNAVREASTALFKNGARPSGILKVASTGTAQQMEELKTAWTARHSGDRAGGIAVMRGDVDFTAVSMPADDAEFCGARRLSTSEVARCFRVPMWMVGAEDGGSMTYSNGEFRHAGWQPGSRCRTSTSSRSRSRASSAQTCGSRSTKGSTSSSSTQPPPAASRHPAPTPCSPRSGRR